MEDPNPRSVHWRLGSGPACRWPGSVYDKDDAYADRNYTNLPDGVTCERCKLHVTATIAFDYQSWRD